MKKLEVIVTLDEAEAVKKTLLDLELSFSCLSVVIENKECKTLTCLVPDQLVDKAIEDLSKIMDLRLKENSIIIYNVEAHVSTHVDKLKEKIIEKSPPHKPL